jgi:hypothetical protein
VKPHGSSLVITIAAIMLLAGSLPATAQDGMGFDVDVTLSRKAAAKLAAEKEGIVVFADYYGDPKRSARKHANEIGQIDLNQQDETVEIPGAGGHARISGAKVDKKRLDWLAGPAKVNVNVASARKANPDNLLACDLIDGALLMSGKHPSRSAVT